LFHYFLPLEGKTKQIAATPYFFLFYKKKGVKYSEGGRSENWKNML